MNFLTPFRLLKLVKMLFWLFCGVFCEFLGELKVLARLVSRKIERGLGRVQLQASKRNDEAGGGQDNREGSETVEEKKWDASPVLS